jgi:GNAT superfamily N-acetyltransferase
MIVVTGDAQGILPHIPKIIEFLEQESDVYQRAIETVLNIQSGSLSPRVFHFAFICDSEERVVGFAYKLDSFPVFVAVAPDSCPQTFTDAVYALDPSAAATFQGSVHELDWLFATPGSPTYTIEREMLLMRCNHDSLVGSSLRDKSSHSIRLAEDRDEQRLEEMLSLFAAEVHVNPSTLQTVATMRQRGYMYVACDEVTDSPVSSVYMTEPSRQVSCISFVFTMAQFRGRGISKALLSVALTRLREGEKCTLYVDAKNEAAIASYKAVVFTPISRSQVRAVLRTRLTVEQGTVKEFLSMGLRAYVLQFLATDPAVFQKPMQTIERLDAASSDNFRFWVARRGLGVAAFAYRLNAHPVFVKFTADTPTEFFEQLVTANDAFQGVVEDLGRLGVALSVERNQIVMRADPSCMTVPGFVAPEGYLLRESVAGDVLDRVGRRREFPGVDLVPDRRTADARHFFRCLLRQRHRKHCLHDQAHSGRGCPHNFCLH